MFPEAVHAPHRGVPIYTTTRDAFPGGWTLLQVQLSGSGQLLDTSPVHFQGRWWVFTTRRRPRPSRLELYVADDLLGEWIPHPQNPLTVDARFSRCGGRPFVFEGQVYRCAKATG